MTRRFGFWLTLLIFLSGPVLEGKVRFGDFTIAAETSQSTALVVYNGEFAAKQILGTTTTPGGRTVMDHAARRMTNPPAGRAPMTMQEIDQVLDTGDKIRKVTPHPQGTTVTVQSTTMPGKPQVVIDAATGKRVITVIKNN